VLVAEDNVVNQKVVLKMLERLGVKADLVADGSDAIGAVTGKPYDLVLMDVQMPRMDGLAATREIRARLPAAAVDCRPDRACHGGIPGDLPASRDGRIPDKAARSGQTPRRGGGNPARAARGNLRRQHDLSPSNAALMYNGRGLGSPWQKSRRPLTNVRGSVDTMGCRAATVR
jgi:CheY-like chemotaxis protein